MTHDNDDQPSLVQRIASMDWTHDLAAGSTAPKPAAPAPVPVYHVEIRARVAGAWFWDKIGTTGTLGDLTARADGLRQGGIEARVVDADGQVVYESEPQP